MAGFDVFLSYAHADRERVLALRDALTRHGLEVWLDDMKIETFESISKSIETGVACSKALVAFYSRAYPTRRPCQWELTAAFVAAQREGDPRRRVLVVNPEPDGEHVQPVELRDALYAAAPTEEDDGRAYDAVARRIAMHVERLDCKLGDLGVSEQPSWFGRRPVGAAHFVGRVWDMWGVHSALTARDAGLITHARGDPAVKVTGMGGIGKSLLAQEYALRFAAAYPGGIFWLAAYGHEDSGQTLSREGHDAERNIQLLGFATELGIDTTQLSPEQVAAALAHELDARREGFLWVVDDLPGELSIDELERWLAPGRFGRTLVTTRSRKYGAVGVEIDLGLLSTQEGFELLATHRSPEGPDEERAARDLVEDLGRHALALDVAGAALSVERGVRSYAAYRDAHADPSADELELATHLVGELPGGHEKSITTTLARSIEGLEDATLDFLRLASRLAVDPIAPDLVVATFAIVDELDQDAARRRAVAAMHEAASRSLAEVTDDGGRQVHTLISRTIRLLEPASSRSDELAGTATTALRNRLLSTTDRRVSADSATLAHARHLAALANDEREARLLLVVAQHDYYRGDFRSARALQEQVLDVMRRVLGAEHPDTLTAIGNLAETLLALGDLDRARSLQEQALDVMRRVLGAEHPDTLRSMGNLAGMLWAQGDLNRARDLEEQVLDVTRRVLGEEHPNTLTSMGNLADTLRAQGDLDRARSLQEQALDIIRRVLGEEHPNTLAAMHVLAETLLAQGDLDRARSLQEQTLNARARLLGDEHRDTLATMSNLAGTLLAQGDFDRARSLQEQALDVMRRVLGEEHPDTLTLMNNLGETLWAQGDLDRARELEEQVLDVMRRVLGEEHPTTLTSMSNLAGTLLAQGDLDRARSLQEQVLNVTRRVLGEEHPTTLTAMSNLAGTLSAQGDLDGARDLEEQALEARARLLGDEHPATLTSMNNLAETLREGDLDRAHSLHEQVLNARARLLGEEHPDTLMSMNNLALTLGAQGDLDRARDLEEQVLDITRRVLGEEHPNTLTSMGNLAGTLWAQGDLDRARSLHEQVLNARARLLGDEHPDTRASRYALAKMLEKPGLWRVWRDRLRSPRRLT
jgi:tetratricopeptide (TPR) repeat protein